MIAIIFEVWPNPEHREAYLSTAASLRPLFEKIDGFVSVERFESLTEPGKLLSLSISGAMNGRWPHGARSRHIALRRHEGARNCFSTTGCGWRR